MTVYRRPSGSLAGKMVCALVAATSMMLLSACETSTSDADAEKTSSSEYFSEKEYGVQASPRIALASSDIPQGGGRYHVGKPYKVKGKWYHPQEDPDYVGVGKASWYGSAFHGRLTANGEVYDMTRLTAAHPTMPLPSYARVTNLDNGSSIIVRVNDRGPFAHDRVIDLSKRAAQLLGYIGAGTAKVKVEYAGLAPIEGQDDRQLLASYQPGRAANPSDGLPAGVMVAMNGSTPSATLPDVSAQRAFASQPGLVPSSSGSVTLPSFGPIVPDRPTIAHNVDVAALSYADDSVRGAALAFDKVLATNTASNGIERRSKLSDFVNSLPPSAGYLSIGSWASLETAQKRAARLQRIGHPVMEADRDEAGNAIFALSLYPDGHMSLDDMLRAAWATGAEDAFAVRR